MIRSILPSVVFATLLAAAPALSLAQANPPHTHAQTFHDHTPRVHDRSPRPHSTAGRS